MRFDTIAGLLLLGVGYVAIMVWYVSRFLQARYGRQAVATAIAPDLTRRAFLLFRGSSDVRMGVKTFRFGVAFLLFWQVVLAIVVSGPAFLIEFAALGGCVAVATYGFILLNRLESTRGSEDRE